jgi:phosphatidylserine decarboxylase
MWIGLESEQSPHRRLVVRQIAGAIARRIVCALRPGDILDRGAAFGMIKLGSRTELIVPDEAGLQVAVTLGQRVQAGATVMVRYAEERMKASP